MKIKDDGKTTIDAQPAIYNRLAVLRAERGLSRQQLAEALGINYQTVGYLERGEYHPSLELAFRISEFFALPIEAIFSRSPFKPMSAELYTNTTNTPRKDDL
jgi:putative transcriptional regulator